MAAITTPTSPLARRNGDRLFERRRQQLPEMTDAVSATTSIAKLNQVARNVGSKSCP